MAETSQEKTEQASEKRKREARRKGTVTKSVDLTNSVVTASLVMVLPVALSSLASGFMQTVKLGLSQFTMSPDPASLRGAFLSCVRPVLPGLGMIIAAALGIGLTCNIAQVGFTFSPEAMTPNFAKLNPFEGVKRLLSTRGLFDTAKASIKTMLFGYMAYSSISAHWSELGHLGYTSPLGALEITGGVLHTLGIRIAITWGVLAGIDYFFQRKQIMKSLMMSKQEVKEEHRDAEGSPDIKMARMRRRAKMRRMRMKQAVQSADVVITNPTHYAVAIKYEFSKDRAPIVVAKGQDLIAANIREIAKQARVPIVPNPPLARALHQQCEIGDFVPRELFQAVAEVLSYVYKTLGRMKGAPKSK